MTIDYGGVLYHVGADGSVRIELAGQEPQPIDDATLPLPVARVIERSRREAQAGLPRRRRRRFVPPDRSPYPWAQPVQSRE